MLEHGSQEWIEARLGRVTASRVSDVMARTKSGWGASRANYMAALIAERLTGKQMESFTSQPMQWGIETEDEARAFYELLTDRTITPAGFVQHPTIKMAGASPDGLVGDDGLVEIKCPNTATHIDTLLGQSVSGKYEQQMLFQMACTGRQWCDFVSYDPRLPPPMRMFTRRLKRDEKRIKEIDDGVRQFLADLETKLGALSALTGSGQTDGLAQSLSSSVGLEELLAAG